MKITPINNSMNFQARLKVAKTVTPKLVLGTTVLTAGTASLYIGADALNIIPSGGLAESIYDNINNEHIVQTPKGLFVVDNEVDALNSGIVMLASLPLGSTVTPLGCYIINKENKELNTEDTNIPT